MPDDDRPDDAATSNTPNRPSGSRTPGGRRLVALGKPPFDDPDPEAMDRFLEQMVAQVRAAEAADGVAPADDGSGDPGAGSKDSGDTDQAGR